jgi:GT2 family glycosyltransferase
MKTMIAIPCMDTVQTEFAQSLMRMKLVGEVQHAFLSCSLIYKSRNDLSDMAVQSGADYMLWLDSDVVFPSTLMVDLMADMEKGYDMISGIYHMRRPPFKPVIWKTLKQGLIPSENVNEDWDDYPRDEVFEIAGCGFGCVMLRVSMLQTIVDKYHELFSPLPGYGEDLSFCVRARSCGFKIHCDPRIQIGHKGAVIISDETFQAYRKAGGQK